MKSSLLFLLGAVLVLLFLVVNYRKTNVGGLLPLIPPHRENLQLADVCMDASGRGADLKFVASCAGYESVCGEALTSKFINDIDAHVGLSSPDADRIMENSYKAVQTNKSLCE